MTWRSSTTTPSDRLLACLPYLLPFLDGIPFGVPLFQQFPALNALWNPLLMASQIYNGIPFLGLIVFFALFLLVVRNESVSYFIRFNTMQAILLDIVLVLCSLVFGMLLGPALGTGLLTQTIYNVIFLGTVAAVAYSVFQSAMGRYAEIPTLSDAVKMQVR